MGYTDIKEWLDAQIAWRNEGLALKEFNAEIDVIDTPSEKKIHLWNIKMAADIMGVELQEGKQVGKNKVTYFMYRGYKIFGME